MVFTKGQILEVHYERNLLWGFTAGAGISTIFSPSMNPPLEYIPENFNLGIAIDPEIRYYFRRKNSSNNVSMDGFFIGFYNSTRISSYTSYNDFENPNNTFLNKINENISINGFQLGYEKVLWKNYIIDIYTGFGKSKNDYLFTNTVTKQSKQTSTELGNFRFNFSIGYSF